MTPGFDRHALRRIRIAQRISQRALADTLSVSFQAVSRWETGAAAPATDNLPALADALDCMIDDLFIRVTAATT